MNESECLHVTLLNVVFPVLAPWSLLFSVAHVIPSAIGYWLICGSGTRDHAANLAGLRCAPDPGSFWFLK